MTAVMVYFFAATITPFSTWGKWCLEPFSLEVIPAKGHDLKSLGVQRPNASHLRVVPNQEALDWRWGEFQRT